MICVVVDGLHAGMLGAYGNSWIRTDHFDRLASESCVFDQAYLTNTRLDQLYEAYWLGRTTTGAQSDRRGGQSLPDIVSTAGWQTTLLTDEPAVTGFAAAATFAEQRLIETPLSGDVAEDVGQTQLARLFTAVTDWLSAPREPFCLWVHAKAIAGVWDAPLPLRDQYADEEDPTPARCVDVPDCWLEEAFDPDELLPVVHAYAGQVSAFDACLGALLDFMDETGLSRTTQCTLLSARGFPLGEHRRIGRCDAALYNELAQLAWVMRFPDGMGAMTRSQSLVVPSDLPGTLLDWLGLNASALPGRPATTLLPTIRGQQESIRDRILMQSEQDRAIRTRAWLLRSGASESVELYAKPSDRWEKNEVGRLCGNVVTGLEAALKEAEQVGQSGEFSPLADILVTEVD